MAFIETRFPTDIAYGSAGGPEYFTDIVITQSGYEQRNANWAQARARNLVVRLPPPHLLPRSADYDELQFHEDSCKLYAAYAWLSYRLADTFPDAEAAQEGMASTSARIDRILQAESYRPRRRR